MNIHDETVEETRARIGEPETTHWRQAVASALDRIKHEVDDAGGDASSLPEVYEDILNDVYCAGGEGEWLS